MSKVKKGQFGIRMMSPLKDKSPAGKNVRRFQKNPFTGATMIKEKDVEYKTKESPRRVYKSTTVSTPKGEKETRVIKEKGKVVKRFQSQKNGGKIKPKASNVSKKLGSAKKSIGNMRFTKKKK